MERTVESREILGMERASLRCLEREPLRGATVGVAAECLMLMPHRKVLSPVQARKGRRLTVGVERSMLTLQGRVLFFG